MLVRSLYELISWLICFSLQGPRPSALIIERTQDNGRTWEPALYMAADCQKSFPGVPTTTPRTMEQTYCYTLPPTAYPYQDQIVSTTQTISSSQLWLLSDLEITTWVIITLKHSSHHILPIFFSILLVKHIVKPHLDITYLWCCIWYFLNTLSTIYHHYTTIYCKLHLIFTFLSVTIKFHSPIIMLLMT